MQACYSPDLNILALREKNILVVVAHPDDETLWFYQGMKVPQQKMLLQFYVSHIKKESLRGKELSSYLKNSSYDIVITHPIHGG